jgi:hypothetical protein
MRRSDFPYIEGKVVSASLLRWVHFSVEAAQKNLQNLNDYSQYEIKSPILFTDQKEGPSKENIIINK